MSGHKNGTTAKPITFKPEAVLAEEECLFVKFGDNAYGVNTSHPRAQHRGSCGKCERCTKRKK